MKFYGYAHVYGDNINTDLIIPGKYTKTLHMEDLAAHVLEDLDPTFRHKMKKGDWLVAGKNFGCGSSREQAPLALKHAGVSGVLAQSFARIFYRNAVNIGLPLVICDTTLINNGDWLQVDLTKGEILLNVNAVLPCAKLPSIMQDILSAGGLVPFLKERGDFIET